MIRLFAALQVAIHHCISHFGLGTELSLLSWLSFFPGVPIFFVVSGFLISSSYERNRNLQSYAYNRFIRIYPALWICFIFSVCSVLIYHSLDASIVEYFRWGLAQLTIGQFYNPEFLRGYGVGVLNGSLWTIPVELQFYLILPSLYFVLSLLRWNRVVVAVFIILLIITNQLYFYTFNIDDKQTIVEKLFGVTILPYLYHFMIGIMIQRNSVFFKMYFANKAHYILIVYLLSVFLLSNTALQMKGNFINPVSALLLSVFVISFAYSYTEKLSGILRGYDISYGVYIYHMVIVNLLIQHSEYSPSMNMIVTLIVTILLATLSWVLVEKPCLTTKRVTIKPSRG